MRQPLDLDALFTYHVPTPEQAERYDKLRAAAKRYAEEIVALTSRNPVQTLAIRKVHEASMLANAAIAVHEPDARAQAAPEAPD